MDLCLVILAAQKDDYRKYRARTCAMAALGRYVENRFPLHGTQETDAYVRTMTAKRHGTLEAAYIRGLIKGADFSVQTMHSECRFEFRIEDTLESIAIIMLKTSDAIGRIMLAFLTLEGHSSWLFTGYAIITHVLAAGQLMLLFTCARPTGTRRWGSRCRMVPTARCAARGTTRGASTPSGGRSRPGGRDTTACSARRTGAAARPRFRCAAAPCWGSAVPTAGCSASARACGEYT